MIPMTIHAPKKVICYEFMRSKFNRICTEIMTKRVFLNHQLTLFNGLLDVISDDNCNDAPKGGKYWIPNYHSAFFRRFSSCKSAAVHLLPEKINFAPGGQPTNPFFSRFNRVSNKLENSPRIMWF